MGTIDWPARIVASAAALRATRAVVADIPARSGELLDDADHLLQSHVEGSLQARAGRLARIVGDGAHVESVRTSVIAYSEGSRLAAAVQVGDDEVTHRAGARRMLDLPPSTRALRSSRDGVLGRLDDALSELLDDAMDDPDGRALLVARRTAELDHVARTTGHQAAATLSDQLVALLVGLRAQHDDEALAACVDRLLGDLDPLDPLELMAVVEQLHDDDEAGAT